MPRKCPKWSMDMDSCVWVFTTNHFCLFSTVFTLQENRSSLRILSGTPDQPSMHMLNGFVDTPLFRHLGSSSWHTNDARLILLFKDVKPKLVFVATVVVLGVLGLVIWCIRSTRHRLSRRDVESHIGSPPLKPLCKYT